MAGDAQEAGLGRLLPRRATPTASTSSEENKRLGDILGAALARQEVTACEAPAGRSRSRRASLALGALILVGLLLPADRRRLRAGRPRRGAAHRRRRHARPRASSCCARRSPAASAASTRRPRSHLPMDWPCVRLGLRRHHRLRPADRARSASSSPRRSSSSLVARGFGSRRWLLERGRRAWCSPSIVFAIFNYGLGLTLPPGVLEAAASLMDVWAQLLQGFQVALTDAEPDVVPGGLHARHRGGRAARAWARR